MRGFFWLYLNNGKKLVTRALIIVNFLPFFVFPSTRVLDIDTWRLLLFSVINTISLSYIFIVPDLKRIFDNIIRSKISLSIATFIVWGFISYFYALNGNEVILRSFTFCELLRLFHFYLCVYIIQ